jgi:hypothetical protein
MRVDCGKVKEKEKVKPIQKKSLTQGAKGIKEFEDELLSINIKKPRTSFNYYISEMRERHNITGNITLMTSEYSKKYQALSASEIAKYDKLALEDKERYQSHMLLVKRFLLEKPFKEKATPYSIYIDEKVREARDRGGDVVEAKENAKAHWENVMTAEEKGVFKEKLEKHLEFYEELRKSPRPPNAYALFMQDQMTKARENNTSMVFQDVAEVWKKTSAAIKERYAKYAEEVAEDARRHTHLYQLAYGLKPKLPISAFRFYYKEACEKGIVNGKGALTEARKLFEKMKEAEKEHYLKLAKKEQLTYTIIKREYNSKNKEERTPSAYNLFMSDLKGTASEKFSEDGFFNYAYQKWKSSDAAIVRKYERQAKKLKEEKDAEYNLRKSFEKSAPKKALNSYNLYVRERMPELKKQNPDTEQGELFVMLAEEYPKLSPSDLSQLKKRAEKDKERYEKEKSEYDMEMSQLNVTQLDKKEEKEEKKRESRGKSKTAKKKDTVKSKSKNKSKSKSKNTTDNDTENDEAEETDNKKGGVAKAKDKDKKSKNAKSKKEESEAEQKKDKKASNRGASKKSRNPK